MNTILHAQNFSFPGYSNYHPTLIFSKGIADNFPEKNERSVPINSGQVRKTLSIIMADDDEDDRDLFKEALEITGSDVNVQFAEDGKRLLEMLIKNNEIPDLIFLDLNMPHKSGMECLAEIRKNDRLKNIPIVIYSTSSSPKDINDSFDHGANLYIKKPNSFNELQVITSKVLSLNWNKYQPHFSRTQFLFSHKTE